MSRDIARAIQHEVQRHQVPLLHVGYVQSIQPGPPITLTLQLSGGSTGTPGISCADWYSPQVGDYTMVLHTGKPTSPGGADWLAIGTVGNSLGWTAPTFLNSWTNYGSPFATAAYRLSGDTVRLRGSIKSGTIGASAFTLPVGMRPPASVVFAVNSNGAFGQLVVDSAGDVGPDVGSNTIFNLDGVSFTVD